jgi:hypothetical protein
MANTNPYRIICARQGLDSSDEVDPFARFDKGAVLKPASVLDPRVIILFPALQTSATVEASAAVCIA